MAESYDWRSPVSFDARSMAKVIREVLDQRGYAYTRERGEKPYSKFMIVMPMPKFAYVYRFRVQEPFELVIETYDTKPTHSGLMPFLEIKDITDQSMESVRELLRDVRDSLPREPWRFTLAQRFQYALLATEYRQARKAWQRMGFKVK